MTEISIEERERLENRCRELMVCIKNLFRQIEGYRADCVEHKLILDDLCNASLELGYVNKALNNRAWYDSWIELFGKSQSEVTQKAR